MYQHVPCTLYSVHMYSTYSARRKHRLDTCTDNLEGSYQMVEGGEPLGNTSAQPAQT